MNGLSGQCEDVTINIDLNVSDVLCSGSADGGIFTQVTGGEEPYTYEWSNASTTPNIIGLVAETYSLTVTDSNGCQETATATVNEPDLLMVTVTDALIPCGGAAVIVEAFAVGGTPPYLYDWGSGFGNGNTITITSIGTYQMTVTDANGCQATTDFTVLRDENISASFEVTNESDCGTNDGMIDATVTGGITPYSYTWSNGSITEDQFGLSGNLVYTVTITDAAGCTIFEEVAVKTGPELSINNLTIIHPVCGDEGVISFNLSWEDGPGSVRLSDGTVVNNGDLISLENLSPGDYVIDILDPTQSCIYDTYIYSVFPSQDNLEFTVESALCDEENGAVTIIPNAGVAPYTVDWSDATSSGLTRTGMIGGARYFVTVTDSEGCEQVNSVYIPNTGGIEINFINANGFFGCAGDSVTLTPAIFPGNTESFFPDAVYSWIGPDGTTIGNERSITVYEPGIYQVVYLPTPDSECSAVGSIALDDAFGVPEFEIQLNPTVCGVATTLSRPFNTGLSFIWTFPSGIQSDFSTISAVEVGWYQLTGTVSGSDCSRTDSIYIASPLLDCGQLSGWVFQDLNNNCSVETGDANIAAYTVQATLVSDPTVSYTTLTSNQGSYSFSLPVGTYQISSAVATDLFITCQASDIVDIVADQQQNYNLIYQAVEDCPRMNASLAIPRLRRCFSNIISISYSNDGSTTATNAQIQVVLDDFLEFQNTITPIPTTQMGQVITFDLGDLPPFASGEIRLVVEVSCNAAIGQTHCVDVIASPNEPCPEPAGWNGALVELNGRCTTDGFVLVANNVGEADMSVNFEYIIVEDGVMLTPAPMIAPPIEAGDSLEIPLPEQGASYFIQSNQEPNAPGFATPTLFLEGCSADFTTGFANLFWDGDELPWYDQLCLANIGSYDPNDKAALPIGYGDQHYIEPETPLDYTIRFQNTGTDTAFTVVIRDTLARALNWASLELGASSHFYTAELDTFGQLTFTFPDILLVDSFTNQLGSNGFVKYSIRPKAGLSLPTLIENTAAIYFDFNEPVITNTVFHTVDTNFIQLTSVVYNEAAVNELLIAPNPAQRGATQLQLRTTVAGPYEVQIFDALGRQLSRQTSFEQQMNLDLDGLGSGWYIVRVNSDNGQWLGTARLLLE